jgi:predicted ribosome quality control (RQC) complex YloA/Tae2 family protein
MLNNYYTLFHLSREFNGLLSGAKILQASTRSKSKLDILFDMPGGNITGLVVSCLPQDNFIYLENFAGRKLKGANVFPEIIGKDFAAVGVVTNERQLCIEFLDQTFLRINLFGSAANIYYTGADAVVINSFLKPSTNTGRKLTINSNSIDFPTDSADLQQRFLNTTGTMVHRLSECVPTVNATLAREIDYRYHLLKDESDDRIDFEILHNTFAEIISELLSPSPRLYLSEPKGKPVAFGLIELSHLKIDKFREYDSLNECVRDFVFNSDKSKKTQVVNADLVGRLNKKIISMRRTLAKIDSDLLNDRAENYQNFGEYLMSHLGDIKQGDGSIFNDESRTEIKLNPALKPVQNAQAFFDKAKHARLSIRQAEQRRKGLTKELQEAEALLQRVKEQGDVSLAKSLKDDRSVSELVSSGDEGSRSPFREFEKNGYRIYVGKDAKNNDALTFGFAKPNDVFLHARGVSGSHVIIRSSSREYPQKEILRFAASIAGHYSKARTSGIVPVAYTMRKFVKKAKGKPGAVFLDREEVIFVKPEIPK